MSATGRKFFGPDGTGILVFMALAVAIVIAALGYWQWVYRPQLRTQAATSAQVLADAYGRSLARSLEDADGSRQHSRRVRQFLHELMLLTDQSTRQPFLRGFQLEVDYDVVLLPRGSVNLELGDTACTSCPVSEVILYAPQTGTVLGLARFINNPSFIERLERQVGMQFAAGTGAMLIFLGLAWVGVLRLMQRVRADEQRFRTIVETAPYPLLVVRSEGDLTVVLASQRIRELLGEPAASLVGRPVRGLLPSAGDGERLAALLARKAIASDLEFRFVNGNGGESTVLVSTEPALMADGPVVIAGFNDITRRCHLEEELRELNQDLERRVEDEVARSLAKDDMLIQQGRHAVMGEMLSSITHQWKQPLTALSLTCDILADAVDEKELTPEAVSQAIADIRRVVARMDGTVSDFRNFFQPAKQRQEFRVSAVVNDTLRLLGHVLRRDGVEVSVRGDAESSGFPNELGQVLMNLLSNAREAIVASSTPADQRRIEIDITREAPHAVIRVSDNGGGIPAAMLPRLFQPYATSKENGTGIGLYMSRLIVDGMGGNIQASNGQAGAIFVIRLPLAGQPSR